jgi:hypothetical protein
MRSLEIVLALRVAEPIPRASRTYVELYAALMFGSRNSMSLCRGCSRRGQFVSARRCDKIVPHHLATCIGVVVLTEQFVSGR